MSLIGRLAGGSLVVVLAVVTAACAPGEPSPTGDATTPDVTAGPPSDATSIGRAFIEAAAWVMGS